MASSARPSGAENADLPAEYFIHREELPFYGRPYSSLSKRMKWRRKIHGLRMAALDPNLWVMRLIDRTDNRVLIPIRPYYLKPSIDSDFRLRRASLRFRFWGIDERAIEKSPATSAGVLDIGFGGEYRPGAHGKRHIVDRSYALRLSMFPRTPSGIIYRSHLSSIAVSPGSPALLSAATNYHVELLVEPNTVTASLNGSPFAAAAGQDLDRGLVSLVSDWHPLQISELKIEGEVSAADGSRQTVQYGGLVPTK